MNHLVTELSENSSIETDEGHNGSEQNPAERLNSRFGPITIFRNKAIHFASGLFGMPDKKDFCIARFPYPSPLLLSYGIEFFILQSLSETTLSFIVAPIDLQASQPSPCGLPLYHPEHLAAFYTDMPYDPEVTIMFCIATVHHHENTKDMYFTLNAKAPLMVDTVAKLGVQYVFSYDEYNVRHPLVSIGG